MAISGWPLLAALVVKGLNLKRFNEHVADHHFKMESLKSVLQIMKPGCFKASVGLKDAYYSVHVDIKYHIFLKFYWRGKLYHYICLPNGLACAPRVFTKPVYSTLHSQGHLSVGYINDSYLQGNTIKNCQNNIQQTVNLFTSQGFLVHPEKSVLVPTRKCKVFCFILDSECMIVSLTPGRTEAIKEAAKRLLAKPHPIILLSYVFRLVTRMNTKRKARKSNGSSTSGDSPVEKRAREMLSSPNSSPERSADVNSEAVEVVEMPVNLESKVDLILANG